MKNKYKKLYGCEKYSNYVVTRYFEIRKGYSIELLNELFNYERLCPNHILLELDRGKDYFIQWCDLFYNIYKDPGSIIHTETLLDLDIYHKIKKVFRVSLLLYFLQGCGQL